METTISAMPTAISAMGQILRCRDSSGSGETEDLTLADWESPKGPPPWNSTNIASRDPLVSSGAAAGSWVGDGSGVAAGVEEGAGIEAGVAVCHCGHSGAAGSGVGDGAAVGAGVGVSVGSGVGVAAGVGVGVSVGSGAGAATGGSTTTGGSATSVTLMLTTMRSLPPRASYTFTIT